MRIFRSIPLILLLLFAALPARADGGERFPLSVATADGPHTFQVEIADDEYERTRGLMWREDLAPDEGMLFDFFAEDYRGFWMKNTPLSLDLVFVGEDGVIRRIAPEAEPFSETPILSGSPVRYVLEIPGGRAAATGTAVGDKVDFAGLPAANRPPQTVSR